MKTKVHIARLAFIAALVGATLQPAFSICQGGISVTEQASVKVPPDEATLVLSVESQESDVDVALQKNNDGLNQLKGFLRKEGVGALEMDPPIIETRYTQGFSNGAQTRTLSGYTVRTTLTCALKDLSKLKVISGGAISHGATNLIGVQLRSSQYAKALADARKQALNKAKARAMELAQQVGQQAGIVTDVGDVSTQQPWSTFNALSTVQSQGYATISLANLSSYGMALPADTSIESNKIIASSNIYLCMEFKGVSSHEKH